MGSLMGGGGKSGNIIQTGDIGEKSWASMVNQTGPGFRTVSYRDPNGQMRQEFKETGAQRVLTDNRNKIATKLMPGAMGMVKDLEGGREAYERSAFDRAMNLLGPQLESQYGATRNSLVNTGNPIGSARAAAEMDQLARSQAAQRTDTALAAVLAGQQGRQSDIGSIGNLFSIMQADRPQYFQAQPLLSPELVLNRSISKAGGGAGKKNSIMPAIGTAVGTAAGAYFTGGNPAGAAAGGAVGGAAGNAMAGN